MLKGLELSGVNFVKFSRDNTSIVVSTDEMAKVFSVQGLTKIAEIEIKSPLVIEQLCGTEVIGVVGLKSPKTLDLFKRNLPFKKVHYDACVLGIDSNRYVMITAFADEAIVHDTLEYKRLYKIGWNLKNVNILFALSQGAGNTSYLAYPCCELAGDVKVCDVSIKRKLTIRAHNSAVTTLAFHPSEQVLATASVKGTVIRLISIPSGTKLFEFRRGIQRNADIYSLSFCRTANFLAASASTGTIHVFKYDLPWHKSEDQSWAEYIGETIRSTVSYFWAPSQELLINTGKAKGSERGRTAEEVDASNNFLSKPLYEAYTQIRSFYKIRLGSENIRNISIVTKINEEMSVAVFTEKGDLFIHSVENEGKEPKSFRYLSREFSCS